MKPRFLTSLAVCVSAAVFCQPSIGQEPEPTNDVYTGAESVNSPVALTYSISAGDEDWILINKGLCEDITFRLQNDGSPLLDGIRLELYVGAITPPTNAVDQVVVVGGQSGSVKFSVKGVKTIYARVTPIDVTGSIDYTLSSTSVNVNVAILADIQRVKKRLKRLQRNLKGIPNSKKKRISRLKKRISTAKATIKKFRASLCSEM